MPVNSFLQKATFSVRNRLEEGYYEAAGDGRFKKRSLKAALEERFCLIAEIKPKSPTAGDLFRGSAEKLAGAYREGGARAVSVICEADAFGGSLSNISSAKKAGLPVLAKDFVISEKQLYAYAARGADAVLLIQELFDANLAEKSRDALIAKARSLGMDVVLESHSEEAFEKAQISDADILGINNRDLTCLTVDVTHAFDVFKKHASAKPVIAESGFSTKEQLEAAKKTGFRGVLVGTALLSAENPLEKTRSLL